MVAERRAQPVVARGSRGSSPPSAWIARAARCARRPPACSPRAPTAWRRAHRRPSRAARASGRGSPGTCTKWRSRSVDPQRQVPVLRAVEARAAAHPAPRPGPVAWPRKWVTNIWQRSLSGDQPGLTNGVEVHAALVDLVLVGVEVVGVRAVGDRGGHRLQRRGIELVVVVQEGDVLPARHAAGRRWWRPRSRPARRGSAPGSGDRSPPPHRGPSAPPAHPNRSSTRQCSQSPNVWPTHRGEHCLQGLPRGAVDGRDDREARLGHQ